jgi:hypothetical protein
MHGLFLIAAITGGAFDSDAIPKAQAEIAAACVASPAIRVNWAEFGDDEPAAKALMDGGLGFLTGAMSTVCKDAALKAEVGKQIQRITLTQAYGAADPVVYINQGTLHIEYLWAKGEPTPDAKFVGAEIASRLRGEEMEAP